MDQSDEKKYFIQRTPDFVDRCLLHCRILAARLPVVQLGDGGGKSLPSVRDNGRSGVISHRSGSLLADLVAKIHDREFIYAVDLLDTRTFYLQCGRSAGSDRICAF